MDNFILTISQVSSILRLSTRYIAEQIRGETPLMESVKKVNVEKGRLMRYFSPYSVIDYAKLHGIRVRADELRNINLDQESFRIISEALSEQDSEQPSEQYPTKDTPNQNIDGGVLTEVISMLRGQLEAKDRQIDDLHERLKESNTLQMNLQNRFLLSPPEEKKKEKEPDFVIVEDKKQKPKKEKKRKKFLGIF
jgi:hypothetical protein